MKEKMYYKCPICGGNQLYGYVKADGRILSKDKTMELNLTNDKGRTIVLYQCATCSRPWKKIAHIYQQNAIVNADGVVIDEYGNPKPI